MNDVILNKVHSIQHCIQRAREEHRLSRDFASDYTRQDAAILNITRACQQSIDLANYVVRIRKLGLPVDSGSSFEAAADAGMIPRELAKNLRNMIGFRNIAVHEYQEISIPILEAVITDTSDELLKFSELMLAEARAN